jgi:hypothetical protein
LVFKSSDEKASELCHEFYRDRLPAHIGEYLEEVLRKVVMQRWSEFLTQSSIEEIKKSFMHKTGVKIDEMYEEFKGCRNLELAKEQLQSKRLSQDYGDAMQDISESPIPTEAQAGSASPAGNLQNSLYSSGLLSRESNLSSQGLEESWAKYERSTNPSFVLEDRQPQFVSLEGLSLGTAFQQGLGNSMPSYPAVSARARTEEMTYPESGRDQNISSRSAFLPTDNTWLSDVNEIGTAGQAQLWQSPAGMPSFGNPDTVVQPGEMLPTVPDPAMLANSQNRVQPQQLYLHQNPRNISGSTMLSRDQNSQPYLIGPASQRGSSPNLSSPLQPYQYQSGTAAPKSWNGEGFG